MSRRKALAEATVEVTPLIDVVFLLLIFFMVSTSFIRETQLGIELATASGEPMEAGTLEIAVRRDGRYLVNGRPVPDVTLAALGKALAEAVGDAPGADVRLVVAADAQSSHQAVVRALEAAGDAGLTRISMVTRQPEDSASPTAGFSNAAGLESETGGRPADAG